MRRGRAEDAARPWAPLPGWMDWPVPGRASAGVGAPAASTVALPLPRGGFVCLFSFFSPPLSCLSILFPPPSPIHRAGARPRPSSAPASPAAASSSNEHLCLAFNGPVLLSLLLSARVVDVVGYVL